MDTLSPHSAVSPLLWRFVGLRLPLEIHAIALFHHHEPQSYHVAYMFTVSLCQQQRWSYGKLFMEITAEHAEIVKMETKTEW